MGITYREGNNGRLTIQQMDDNFHYLEEQLAGLTSSNSGAQGATGPRGATGPQGPAGATGPAGEFVVTGGISFPFLPGNQRTGSGDNLQFEKGSVYQKIISTQDGTGSAPTVERLVISGGDSYSNGPTYSGEGGDIYLWAGKGQNGGDIKVDAGEGIEEGGTVKIRGGYTETGNGGFIEIYAGESSDGDGGDVEITAGSSANEGIGGSVVITSGYGATGGNILLDAGNGDVTGGNVIVRTEGGNERMRITADGKIEIGTTTPALSLNVILSGDLNINTTRSGIQSTSKITTIGDWQNQVKGNKINIDDAADFAFYTNLATNGKFGINTQNPLVALDVNGDVNITGVITSTSSMILKPDSSLDTDQYIILDPTEGGPNHIHIRAGGPIDDSSADLFIGGEDNNLRVSDTTKTVQINSKNLYTQDSASFSVGPGYDSATWSSNLITITNPDGDLADFINGYQIATDIFTVFYDPTTGASLDITNKNYTNWPTIILTVEQTAPTASLAITGIEIVIERYQSGRVIADNGTVTIQAGDIEAPKNWSFGMTGGNGTLTFPDNSVQTTAYAPKYKVYTALLTQSGGDDPFGENGGTAAGNYPELMIGRTYYIADNFQLESDFTNVGAPNNNVGTYFVATGTTPASWGTYALLQYNTGAPVVTVLENTIGNIWFRQLGVGYYAANSNGLFTLNKTFSPNDQTQCISNGDLKYILFINSLNNDELRITTLDNNLNNTDDALTQKFIEIRLYN